MALYMSMCERCAEKIGKRYAINEASMSFFGSCPQCFTPGKLIKYDIGPSYSELDRKRRQARAGDKTKAAGGGERARAGRRAR